MSVCAKFQLSSWSRSGWIVCVGWGGGGGGEHVTTVSNSNAFAELRWVLTIIRHPAFSVAAGELYHYFETVESQAEQ